LSWAEVLEAAERRRLPFASEAEQVLVSEESDDGLKPASLSWAEFVFAFEETEALKPKPVIRPVTLVAYLPKPITVLPPRIFPVTPKKPKKPKPVRRKPLAPIIVALQTLSISVDKDRGYVGDVFTFTGQLVKSGTRKGYTVYLYKDSVVVGSGVTDARGNYSIPWTSDAVGTYNFHTECTV
jgi:hypothetical protein